jgi:hypothetical protein
VPDCAGCSEASASHADDMLRRGIDIRYVFTSLPHPKILVR